MGKKFKHSAETWKENIRLAQAGCKKSIDWVYSNVYPMFMSIAQDEDMVQELLTHFHTNVLPKIDLKYIPINLIYMSAKRIMINIRKRRSRISYKDEKINEEINSIITNGTKELQDIEAGQIDLERLEEKDNESYEVIVALLGDLELIKSINPLFTSNNLECIQDSACNGLFSKSWQ